MERSHPVQLIFEDDDGGGGGGGLALPITVWCVVSQLSRRYMVYC